MDSTRVWLTTGDLAERLRTAPGTVRYWRHAGIGPQGVKIGRRVLYALDEVERWEAAKVAEAAAA
ncbi:MAG: helix-turn-helix domain-containing protein [Micromonospora sp.]